MSTNNHKKVLVILSQTPYGGSLAREAIDYCLASAAFEQNIDILFTGDAVLQLLKDQKPENIHQKNLSKTISALPMYGIEQLYVDQDALNRYHLNEKQLCLPVTLVSSGQMTNLLNQANSVLNF